MSSDVLYNIFFSSRYNSYPAYQIPIHMWGKRGERLSLWAPKKLIQSFLKFHWCCEYQITKVYLQGYAEHSFSLSLQLINCLCMDVWHLLHSMGCFGVGAWSHTTWFTRTTTTTYFDVHQNSGRRTELWQILQTLYDHEICFKIILWVVFYSTI